MRLRISVNLLDRVEGRRMCVVRVSGDIVEGDAVREGNVRRGSSIR